MAEKLERGWIHPTVSPYGAPILFVCKKMGELHMRVDFCGLNHQIRLDMFPIPCIHDLLDKPGKAHVFSAVNLSSAYHEVRIKEGHKYRTDFLIMMDLYEYVAMPWSYQCTRHISICNEPDILGFVVQVCYGVSG